MSSLTQVASDQHGRLMAHVDQLPRLADEIASSPDPDAGTHLASEHDFLLAALIPHMAVVETSLHRELDRLLSCRLAMTPLAREHETIKDLVVRIGELRGDLQKGAATPPAVDEIASLLRQLHEVLARHLAEEAHYVTLLDRYVEPSRGETLASAVEHA